MARGINKVILVGNIGQDPETKYTAGGSAITNISLATSDTWKDKQTGQAQERTEWHRIVFFNRLAEIAGEYLRKGSKVYVEGRLQTRKWQDQSGQDRYTTEIVANDMQMLDSRGDNMQGTGSQAGGMQGGGSFAPQQSATAQRPGPSNKPNYGQQGQGDMSPAPPPPDMDSFDDDIPF